MAHLIGLTNEAEVVINEVLTLALIDTGALVSTIEYSLAKKLGLEIKELEMNLMFEGTRRFLVSYSGVMEVNLRISQFPEYKDAVLMLVISNSPYTKMFLFRSVP